MDAAKSTQPKRHRLTQPTNYIGGQVTLCPCGPSRAFGAAANGTHTKRRRITRPTNYIGGQVPPTLLGTQRANNVGDTALLPLRSKSCLWRRSEKHTAKAQALGGLHFGSARHLKSAQSPAHNYLFALKNRTILF